MGIFYEKGHLFEKGAQKFHPPLHSTPFLHVLHQNKALHNFCKSGQGSIVEHNIGLEYALSIFFLYFPLHSNCCLSFCCFTFNLQVRNNKIIYIYGVSVNNTIYLQLSVKMFFIYLKMSLCLPK